MSDDKDDIKKSPFGEAENWQMNACVGLNGGPYDYWALSKGYFSGGHVICESIMSNHGIGIDILFYPLMQNYRQGLELGIKHLRDDNHKKGTHNLKSLWAEVREGCVAAFGDNDEEREQCLSAIDTAVDCFHEIDPNNEGVRYPESKDGKPYLTDRRIVNIIPVYEKMKKAELALSFIDHLKNG
jgi:hypothetical protein